MTQTPADKKAMDALTAAAELLADELQGMPLHVPRANGGDFVFVASATYNDLIARIHDLEDALKSPEERAAEQARLVDLL